MMGERTVAQEALFYEFSLERHVPADHLLRSIDRFVDLSELRKVGFRQKLPFSTLSTQSCRLVRRITRRYGGRIR